MANSKYAYVRQFEQPDSILPNTWIVIRIDGRAFHRFSSRHGFDKPNDARALRLMNEAAKAVFRDVQDVVLAYGQSDEFSFVLPPHSTLFDRRASKLISIVVSTFTAYYMLCWPEFFLDTPLARRKPSRLSSSRLPGMAPGSLAEESQPSVESCAADMQEDDEKPRVNDNRIEMDGPAPTFDARAVPYPSIRNLRDYLSWRQADCHINNLFNTTFWALVEQGGLTHQEAEKALQGTFAADKNEILFSRFGINYNNEPAIYRKGSVLFRNAVPAKQAAANTDAKTQPDPTSKTQQEKERKRNSKAMLVVEHVDIIEDAFWETRPWILG